MANYEIEATARALRYEATMHLRDEENIKRTLRYFSVQSEGFTQRVGEFEAVCSDLYFLIESSTFDQTLYKNVTELKHRLGSGYSPRSVVEAIGICQELREEGEYAETSRISDAFVIMNQKIGSGEWAFARQITDNPNKLASALLIAGYGVYIEKLSNESNESGMARIVSLACMEVLFTNYPESALLRDVIEWMKEQRADFDPEIADRL